MYALMFVVFLGSAAGLLFLSHYLMDDHEIMGGFVGAVAILLLCFWAIIACFFVINYFDTISSYGELRGIKNSFVSVEKSIEMTKDSFYVVSGPALLDAVNLKQSTNVSESISKARDTIVDYNVLLGKLVARREFKATRIFCPPVPADLKPLVWSEK